MLPESEPFLPQEPMPHEPDPHLIATRDPLVDMSKQPEQKALASSHSEKAGGGDKLLELQEAFITAHSDIFYLLLQGSSVRIKPGNDFFISYRDPIEISLGRGDWQQWLERKIDDDEQMLWSTCHEIAHFLDLVDDPHEMMSNFEIMETTAKRKARLLFGRWKESIARRYNGVVPDYFNEQFVAHVFEQALQRFYNCLDDVYTNNMVAQKIPGRYGVAGVKKGVVEELYREQLFPSSRISDRLKSEQLGIAILRRSMVPGEETVVSSEVDERLKKPLTIGRISGTVEKLFGSEHFLRPRRGENNNKPGRRYSMIRAHLEPLFWELMELDIDTGFVPQLNTVVSDEGELGVELPGMSGGKSDSQSEKEKSEKGEQGEKDAKSAGGQEGDEGDKEETEEREEGEKTNPWDIINQNKSPISRDAIEAFIKSKKEYEDEVAAKEEDRRLTPAERAKKAKIARDATLAYAFNELNPERAREIAEEWAQLRESVESYIEELDKVFEQFLRTINERISMAWESGFKSGRFSVDDFIKKYAPELAVGSAVGNESGFIDFNNLEAFMQREFTSRLRIVPNNLTFRLVLDNSGSMSGERIIMVKQLMVLIYESIKSLEARVNLNYRLRQPFRIDLQVQTFGRDTHLAKSLGTTGEEERGQMLAALGFLTAKDGSTHDAQAWENIIAELESDGAKIKQIKKGSARDITIELTDGQSETAQETREEIRAYMALGGVPCGIMIGGGEEIEGSTFASMFQDRGRHVESASQLPEVFCDLLEERFKTILSSIEVESDDSDDYE